MPRDTTRHIKIGQRTCSRTTPTPTTTTTGGAITGTRDAAPTARRSGSFGGGRGRGGMVRRGEIRPLILAVLATKPMHGYEVITELEAQSGGRWRPSAGSVYPTLQQLADEGLVTSEEIDGRRVYALTDEGKAAAAAAPRSPWADAGRGAATTSASSARQVAEAAMQVQRVGHARGRHRGPGDPASTRAPSSTACSPATPDRAATCRPTMRTTTRRSTRPDARLEPRDVRDERRDPALRRAGPRLARATSSRRGTAGSRAWPARRGPSAAGCRRRASPGAKISENRTPPRSSDAALRRQLRVGRAGLREATDDRLLELVHRLVELLVVRLVEVLVGMEVRRVDVRSAAARSPRWPAAPGAPRASRPRSPPRPSPRGSTRSAPGRPSCTGRTCP